MSNLESVSDSAFEADVLGNNKPVIVDFWAEWCGPCKAIAPYLEKLSESTPEVSVKKMDIDQNTEWAPKFGIRSIPTMILFHKGEEVDRVVGMDNAALQAMFEKGQKL